MYQYVAFLYGHDVAAREHVTHKLHEYCTKRPEWNSALETPDLTVLHSGVNSRRASAYPFPNGHGIVVGKLFTRLPTPDEHPANIGLQPETAARLVATAGKHLIDNLWGRYIAIWNDPSADRWYVMRDPSGGLPCFFLKWRGVTVVFSDFQMVIDLGMQPLTLNWNYLSAFLLHNHIQISDTGFEGISELQPGERLQIGNHDTTRRFLWDPAQIACADPIEDFKQACFCVRDAAQTSIGLWASGYDTILHQLSGGLDSGVVLSCLANSPRRPQIICENQFSPLTPESDERTFARVMARSVGCDLIETEMQVMPWRLEKWHPVPASPRPSLRIFTFQHTYLAQLAAEYNVDAFTNGHGGDQIFFQYSEPIIAADYAHTHGVGLKLLSTIRETTRLSRGSVWSALRSAFTHGALRRPFDIYGPFIDRKTLLTNSAVEAVDPSYLMHPWLKDATHVPPGKLMHILYVVDLQYMHEPSVTSRVADAPILLASQPLVEVCLRIPTYVLVKGGTPRALERQAFQDSLPREIVSRETKGGTTRFLRRMLTENLPFIRELLLDGQLARQGLLNRHKLEERLSREILVRLDGVESLFTCVAAELWAGKFVGSLRAAA